MAEVKELWNAHEKNAYFLEQLIEQKKSSAYEIEICTKQIQEIEEVHLKEGEEEVLFEKYSYLLSGEERKNIAHKISQGLRQSLNALSTIKADTQTLLIIDSSLKEDLELFNGIKLETEELSHTLQKYLLKFTDDPNELKALDERLTKINQLKRKYGTTYLEIMNHRLLQKEKLELIHNLDEKIENAKKEKEGIYAKLLKASSLLSNARQKASLLLAKKMNEELAHLYMKKATFLVQITSQPITALGSDLIEFFIKPNVGEKLLSLKEGASGGELARVLLALHVILCSQTEVTLLIFDEIDANIGGQAAKVIGEKLHFLGKSLQVFCITHFPQVARLADHHLQISKSTNKGRTFSSIEVLSSKKKEQELSRMVGI